jgi:hypothetical protein
MFGLSVSDTINVSGIIVTLLSLAYGIIQNNRRKTLERLVANDAIEIHDNVTRGLGAIQTARTQTANGENPSLEIGRTEGYLQALLTGTAKNFCNIKKTTIEDVDEMIKNGQLQTGYRNAYVQYSSNEKRGYLRSFSKWLKKIWQ